MPITIDGSGNITGLVAGGLPDLSVTNADLATNAVSTSKLLDSAVTTAKLGSNEQAGLAKAWVNFNGTGTVAIRASGNVSSITDNGTGDYTVNFTNALADANYGPVGMTALPGSWYGGVSISNLAAPTTTALRIVTHNDSGTGSLQDSTYINVAIFRNEGAGRSSDLIRSAVDVARLRWPAARGPFPSRAAPCAAWWPAARSRRPIWTPR